MISEIRLTLLGQAASKANSRRAVVLGGRTASIKSPSALAFEKGALLQIPIECRVQWECDVAITIHMFYASRRSDLDESIVLDVLQSRYKKKFGERFCVQRGVYENDRQVKEKHIFWHLDPDNPRVEVAIRPLAENAQPALFDAAEVQPVGRPSDRALAVAQAAARAKSSVSGDGNPF